MRLLVGSLLLVAACASYDDLALLELQRIEPTEIEPGTTVRIHGTGFPLGSLPTLTVNATVHRPGRASETMELPWVGYVRSDVLIEVPIRDEDFAAVGGRATLDGRLRVSFDSHDGRREVFAEEPLTVDFLPDTAMQLRSSSLESVEQPGLGAASFGIELSREDLGVPGVRVLAVDPEGLAARQGMKRGDSIVAVDGLRVVRWTDFRPDPTLRHSTVLVARQNLRGVHALRWPHDATERAASALALLLFGVLGVLLGARSAAVLWVRPLRPVGGAPTWLLRAALLVVASAGLVLLPALQWATAWILLLGTAAALNVLLTRDARAATNLALVLGATLTVMLLLGTASIQEINAAQRAGALHVLALQSPASSMACLSFIAALGGMGGSARVSAAMLLAPAAVLGAVLFLGGWPIAMPAIAIGIVVLKATSLVAASCVFHIPRTTALCLCGAGLALAAAEKLLPLHQTFPEWGAFALGFFVALLVLALVPPLRRAREPMAVA
jgi:hypothetical protein